MQFSDADRRAIRRHAGAPEFDRWLTLFTEDEDLVDLWTQFREARLVAAELLTSLASPTLEGLRKLGDVTVDRKGQMAAYLERAASLRAAVAGQRGFPAASVTPWGVDRTFDPDRRW